MGLLTNQRQTVIVTCRTRGAVVMGVETEKDNAITIDWHMPVSFSPQLYAISVGKSRFSYKIITESKAFVVNFLTENMAKEALDCGRKSGEHRDKLKEAGIRTHGSDNVDCPRIAGAAGHLECEVVQEIEAGDHVIFIGKVVHAELMKEGKRLFHVDGDDFTTTIKGWKNMDTEEDSKLNALAKSLKESHLVANMDEGIEKAKEIMGMSEAVPTKSKESSLTDPTSELKTVKEMMEGGEELEKDIDEFKDEIEEVKEDIEEEEKALESEETKIEEVKEDIQEGQEIIAEAKEGAKIMEEEEIEKIKEKSQETVVEDDWGNEEEVSPMEDDGQEMKEEE